MSTIDLWYATRATGMVALLLITATTIFGLLAAGRAKSDLPAFARVDLHRKVSALSLVFLILHVVTSVLDPYVNVGWLAIVAPFTSTYQPLWIAIGAISVDLFLAVAISGVLRKRISAQTWRTIHWLSYLSWPTAIIHTIGSGTDMKLNWMLGLVALNIAAVLGVGIWRFVSTTKSRSALPRTIVTPRRSLRPTLRQGGTQ